MQLPSPRGDEITREIFPNCRCLAIRHARPGCKARKLWCLTDPFLRQFERLGSKMRRGCVRYRIISWCIDMGVFLKWWVSPTTMGFPTKNDHFGVFSGYHHLRKHPYTLEIFFFLMSKFFANYCQPQSLTTSPPEKSPGSQGRAVHFRRDITPGNQHSIWKWMVGRLCSFSDGLFRGYVSFREGKWSINIHCYERLFYRYYMIEYPIKGNEQKFIHPTVETWYQPTIQSNWRKTKIIEIRLLFEKLGVRVHGCMIYQNPLLTLLYKKITPFLEG